MTSATDSAEIGEVITAGGIETNVHIRRHPTSSDTVLLLHGSGPGVSAFANWRLTIPYLEQEMTVIAPDIVGFGFTERPADVSYDLKTWTAHAVDVLDALGVGRAHVVGNSFRWRPGSLVGRSSPAPGRPNGSHGCRRRSIRHYARPDAVWGYEPSVENMRAIMEFFAYDKSLLGDDLAALRYQASIRPGVQEAFHAMFPEPRQAALDALCLPQDQVKRSRRPHCLFTGATIRSSR